MRNYGGDFEIARSVTLLHDQFEVILFEGPTATRYVKYFAGMALNRLAGMSGVTVVRADRVTISSADDRRAYVQIDGEFGGTLPAEFRIVPDALTLLAPDAYRSDAPAVVFHGLLDGVVLLGEAHQLQADGVYQGLPTGLDDVVADPDRGPAPAVVAPFDQHAHFGGGALVGIEHADFVVGQADVGDLRVELARGTCAGRRAGRRRGRGRFGGGVDAVLRFDGDGGGGGGWARRRRAVATS